MMQPSWRWLSEGYFSSLSKMAKKPLRTVYSVYLRVCSRNALKCFGLELKAKKSFSLMIRAVAMRDGRAKHRASCGHLKVGA